MIQSSSLFPSFGYNGGRELTQKLVRKKYDLEERKKLPDHDDIKGNQNALLGDDADWVNFEAVMSTDLDQIAMAPGYLQKEWQEEDRRYFHYKMDDQIFNFFTFYHLLNNSCFIRSNCCGLACSVNLATFI